MSDPKINGSPKGGNMSRYKMLQWVNGLVQGRYTRIEDLCSGVAYCRMFALIFPDCIQLKRVKINPKLDHEYVHNLRLLQDAFNRIHLDKVVPIDRLIPGRFKHNFEFVQWFQKFYDSHVPQLEPKKPAVHLFKSRFYLREKSHLKKPEQKKASVIKPIKPNRKKQSPIQTPEPEKKQILAKVPEIKPLVIPKEESSMNTKKGLVLKKLKHKPVNGRITTQMQRIMNMRDLSYRKLLMIEKLIITHEVNGDNPLWNIFERINAVLQAPMKHQDSAEVNEGAGNPADPHEGMMY